MKAKRLYSLFVKTTDEKGKNHYKRYLNKEGKEYPGYTKEAAVRIYQNHLLASAFGNIEERLELRMIQESKVS